MLILLSLPDRQMDLRGNEMGVSRAMGEVKWRMERGMGGGAQVEHEGEELPSFRALQEYPRVKAEQTWDAREESLLINAMVKKHRHVHCQDVSSGEIPQQALFQAEACFVEE
jgi:hypothetical protein